MVAEEKIKIAKQKNVKLYPIYKLFAWDLLFYYSIYFLFLSQVKGLSASLIALGNASYPAFKLILHPLAPSVIHIIGKRKATILGNIFVSLSIIYIILSPASLLNWIITNLIMAIGYIFKGICEASILDESILDKEKKNSIFSKIDGKGSAYWYAFEAISAMATGFLFVFNGYLPMYVCFCFCIVGTLLATSFEPYEEKTKKVKEEHPIKRLINRIDIAKQEYAFILKSKRLHALLLFSGLFYGTLYIRSTLTNSMLVELNVPDKYFGIITSILTIFAAITTWQQNIFHKKLRNKVLTFFSITYSISMIMIGIIATLSSNNYVSLGIILSMMIIQNMIKGPYYTLIKRYLNSFSDEHISVKIYSINSLVEDVCGIIMSLIVSVFLSRTNTAYTMLFMGLILLILFILVLDYMKTRLGLKPEEYRKQDIEFIPKTKMLSEKESEDQNVVEIHVGIDENGNTDIEVK